MRVMGRGWYILGEEVQAFEREFAEYLGVQHAVGVGSGTEALHVALKAIGVQAGDEVITVSHTAVATVSAIELAGGIPVFADIEEGFYTIDPQSAENLITPRTKAIVAVHLYGQPADMDGLCSIAKRHGILLVEDCAQTHGAEYKNRKVGSIGDIGCFSFYPTKNLGAIGDGGMVVTNNAEFAQRAKLMREYGWSQRYISSVVGWNSRLDEIQAAILRVKLRYLDSDNLKRQNLARVYDRELSEAPLMLPKQREDSTHAYHLYVIGAHNRNELQARLDSKGVVALVHYPYPIHLQPAYKSRLRCDNLSRTERAAQTVLSLPMYPELTEEEVLIVVKSLKEMLSQENTR